jgi:hypothetical protein
MDEQVTSVNTSEVAAPETNSEQVNESASSVENAEVAAPQQNEKPAQSAEDNAKYAAIRREAEQKAKEKARDELIAEMYGESHGIHSYAEYQQALAQQQEQARIQELIENNVPEDVAKEVIESKKFREQYAAEQKTRAEQEARNKDFTDFLTAYPDVKAESIPAEVWEENSKGKSLVDAYAKYENKLLKAKIAEFEKGQKAQEVNAKHAESSTGSVTGNGSSGQSYFTQEQVEAMSRAEINRHWKAINESMKNWK